MTSCGRFKSALLADRSLTNICLSASIAQVEAGDNLPNKTQVLSFAADAEIEVETHLKCPWFFADNTAVY